MSGQALRPRNRSNVAVMAAELAQARSGWIDQWPAVVILAGVGITLLWIGLIFWLAWSAVEWLIG
jgi:hypothetical protein